MADETEEEGGGEGGGKKGGKSLLIIIIVVLFLALAGGGAAVYFLVLKPKPATEEGKAAEGAGAEGEAAGAAPVVSLGETVEMQPFIVNLSGGSSRYLKVTIVLQLSTAVLTDEISKRTPQLKDAVITVLSSKSPEEILSIQGKYDLKVEIMKRINSFLTTGVVRELYFVEFVVQ